MMDEHSLMELSARFKDVRQLEKDYLLTLLLHEIYSKFTGELIFKGGTSLKFFFNLNRFSEDLDFSYTGLEGTAGRRRLNEKMDSALEGLGLQYEVVDMKHRGNKIGNTVIGINYEIRVRGPLNHRLGELQNIKIDMSTRNDVIRDPETRYLSPIYPDITTFSLSVMNIQEILAEKIAAVFERDRMRDIYDIYYLSIIRGVKFERNLVEEKMSRRGETFETGKLYKKLQIARSKMRWKSELAYLVNPLPDNAEVISKLEETLDV